VIVVDNNSPNDSIEYIKAWADGKLDVWVKPDNSLRQLSFPPITKPVPYVFYTKEEAQNGGFTEYEKKYESLNGLKYPLIIIQAGENLGFAGGNNIGIKYVLRKDDFDSVILLNNDTVINKNALSEMIFAWYSLGDDSIYGGRIHYYSKKNKLWYDGGKFNRWTGRTIHINMDKNEVLCKDKIKEINFITFCFVLIPKNILMNVGLMNESYFMYVEDLDYSYRVQKNGYKLYHVCTSEIYHKVGASSEGEISEFTAYWIMKNRVNFFKSNLIFPFNITAFACLFFTRLLRYPYWLLSGKSNIIIAQLKALLDGICA
jgi:GT2 family glycosyltransferase